MKNKNETPTVYCPQCGRPEATPPDCKHTNNTTYICCHDCWCENTWQPEETNNQCHKINFEYNGEVIYFILDISNRRYSFLIGDCLLTHSGTFNTTELLEFVCEQTKNDNNAKTFLDCLTNFCKQLTIDHVNGL